MGPLFGIGSPHILAYSRYTMLRRKRIKLILPKSRMLFQSMMEPDASCRNASSSVVKWRTREKMATKMSVIITNRSRVYGQGCFNFFITIYVGVS